MDRAILGDAHRFWFGELDSPDDYPVAKSDIWFKPSDDTDAVIRERFGPHLDAAAAADWDLAALSRQEQIGLVVLLDQFPRNIFRVSGRAFAYDAKAREVARALVAKGVERFYAVERSFLFMPFMHSEEIRDQDECVALFAREALTAPGDGTERMRGNLDYAFWHRGLIRKFGRFPHRNQVLGRESNEDEKKHLDEKGRGY